MDSHEVRREWADRSGEFSPGYYAYYGADETSARVRELLDDAVGADAAVLEVGCSAGRHLAHLHEHGYRDLHGVDVNPEAFDVLAETYPDLAADGTFHAAPVAELLDGVPDDRYDAVYTVETLQHLHPDDRDAFAALARVAGELLVTVEIEGDHERSADGDVNFVDSELPLYYRDWGRVFTDLGLEQVERRRLGTDTLRAFRPR